MQNRRVVSGAAAILAVLVCAGGCSAQPAKASSVRSANASDLTAAHAAATSLLPNGARDAEFDDKQAVTVSGSPQVAVLPVRFKMPLPNAPVEGQMVTQCGVVVASRGMAPKLVVTLGTGNTEMMTCTAIKAIGGAPPAKAGERSDLILIYDAYTGRESAPATILLDWDHPRGSYIVDEATSQWLGERKEGRTVAGARRLLAAKRRS